MRCLCLYPVKCPGVCPVHSPVSAPSAQTKESECRVCGGAVYCVLCTVPWTDSESCEVREEVVTGLTSHHSLVSRKVVFVCQRPSQELVTHFTSISGPLTSRQ